QEGKPVNPAFIFAVMLWFPLRHHAAQLEKEGVEPLNALEQAMAHIIANQNKLILIPKRHTQIMREMWLLQFRFPKRQGTKAEQILEHPRFRAAYDLLVLRSLAADESVELAQWWTTYQTLEFTERERMTLQFAPKPIKRKRTTKKT
ncbi:MAG: polynucleotide adenylyltransferase PcnB, partial [Legionellaceae bacterium]